jgi:hypothetical protein
MPTYLTPVNGVSLSEAEAEAATIAPIGRVALDTLEFYRSDFDAPARVVNDRVDFTGTLEADAPRSAGEAVTFTAVGVTVVWPSETDEASAPKLTLEIDGVSAILTEQLNRGTGTLEPLQVLPRRYMSDDPGGPSRLPVQALELSNVQATETRVTADAVSGDDPVNRRFPALAYRRARYPGLSAR